MSCKLKFGKESLVEQLKNLKSWMDSKKPKKEPRAKGLFNIC